MCGTRKYPYFFVVVVVRITRVWVEENDKNLHSKKVSGKQTVRMWPNPFSAGKNNRSALIKHQQSPANTRMVNTRLMIKSFSRFIIKLYEKRERERAPGREGRN